MKYVMYCRKSTDNEDKQVLSLESQENELKRLAEALKIEVVAILKESKSAKEPGRPIFDQMIKMINSGKAEAVLCWKVDRLTRNPVDGGQIQWLLQKGKIKCIQTFEKSYLPSDNVLLMSIEQAMANQYIRDLSINVKRGNRTKLEKGEWPNLAPLGYLNDKVNKKIIIDPSRKKYIVRAFELYKTGKYGYKQVAEILYKEGLRSKGNKKVSTSKIQYILSNPFYYGVMRTIGKLYRGEHKPIISKNLFDSVQETAQSRLHPRNRKLMFPIRGLIKCQECGCMYTASRKKGHDYYYCTNGKKICTSYKNYIREKDLYELMLPILNKLSFDKDEIEFMYESAKEDTLREAGYFNEAINKFKKEEALVSDRQNKLLDVFLDGSISKEVYDSKNIILENEKVNIQKQLKEIEDKAKVAVSTLEPVKNLFLSCNIWAEQFLKLKPEEKQNIAHELLWNLSMKDKNIFSYQLKSPYLEMAKLPQNASLDERLGYKDSNLD